MWLGQASFRDNSLRIGTIYATAMARHCATLWNGVAVGWRVYRSRFMRTYSATASFGARVR